MLTPNPKRSVSRDISLPKPYGFSSPMDTSAVGHGAQPGALQAREAGCSPFSLGPAHRVSRDTFLPKPHGCSSLMETRAPSQGTRNTTPHEDALWYPQGGNAPDTHNEPLSPTPPFVTRWFQVPRCAPPANPRPAVTSGRTHQQGETGIRSPAVLARVAPPCRALPPGVGKRLTTVPAQPPPPNAPEVFPRSHPVRSPATLRAARHSPHTPAMTLHAPPCSLHRATHTTAAALARHDSFPSCFLPSFLSHSYPTASTFPSLGSSGSPHRGTGHQPEPADNPLPHRYPPNTNPTENSDTVVHTFFCNSLPAPRHVTVDIPSLQPPSPVLHVPTGPAPGAGR